MSKKQVKLNELSYGKIRNVAQLLTNEDSIDLHWKELAAKYDRYQPRHISAFQAAKNPAEALLQDLGFRNVPVDDVYSKLQQMGHKQAMSVLANDGRESAVLCVSCENACTHTQAHTHTGTHTHKHTHTHTVICKTVGSCFV